MSFEIRTPFHVGEDGKVDTTSNPDAQIRQHVLSLVNTVPTERVMLPTYGINAQALVFEDMDVEEVAMQVSTLVTRGFATWEPGVELVSVIPESSTPENVSMVDVQYQRNTSQDSLRNTNINSAIIGADGTVKEFVKG